MQIAQIVRGQTHRQRQPPALQRQQIFFRAKILRTAEKLNIKDNVFIFHCAAFGLAYRVKGARRQHKDVPALCRTDLRTGLHKAAAAFYIDQLHAVLPVNSHLPKVPRYGAGVDIERKAHFAMVLGFLQRRSIVHGFFLLMLG